MRNHARMLAILLSTLGALLVVPPPGGASGPDPLTRQHLLTLGDYESVYPTLRQPSRVVLRSPVFAPRGCEDQGQVVRGATRILGSLSTGGRRRSVALIDQNLVRFDTVAQARSLVGRYRHFSKACVGDVRTDDGEGGRVLLKNRAWQPPRVGDQSAGMLIGWFSFGSASWRRVLAVRVGGPCRCSTSPSPTSVLRRAVCWTWVGSRSTASADAPAGGSGRHRSSLVGVCDVASSRRTRARGRPEPMKANHRGAFGPHWSDEATEQ